MNQIRRRCHGSWFLPFFTAVAAILSASACATGFDQSGTPESAGVVIEVGGYWGGPPADEAARRADLIVMATVDEPGPSFWTTLDGQRPELTAEGELPELAKEQLRWGSGGRHPDIFTPRTFTVTEAFKGQIPESGSVLIITLGGTVEPGRFENPDLEDAFLTGDEIVLFLADCGPERADRFGTPYRLVDRYAVNSAGNARAILANEPVDFEKLLEVIEEQKDAIPLAQVSCD